MLKYPNSYDDDFINTFKRAVDYINAHGRAIQDLVVEGQLTEEQYAELLTTINGLVKSGGVDEYDLSPTLRSKIRGVSELANRSDLQDLQNQIVLQSGSKIGGYFEGSESGVYRFNGVVEGLTISNDAQDLTNYSYNLLNEDLWQQGSLSSANGEELESVARIRTKFASVAPGMTYNVSIESPSEDYTAIIIQYDRLYKFVEGSEWQGSPIELKMSPETMYVRVILQNNNNTVTVDSVLNNISKIRLDVNRINLNTDIRFSKYLKNTPDEHTAWEQGTLTSSTGAEGDSPSRIRTDFLSIMPDEKGKVVWLTTPVVTDDYRVTVLQYDSNQSFISTSGWQNNGFEFTTSSNTAFIRLLMERGAGSSVTPEDAFGGLDYFKIISDEILLRSGEVFTVGFNNLEAVNVESEVPYRLYGLEG